ncbi:FAD-dependent oxidoreductase [Richelia sinica]|nr:FAD-dependent oxidoreductase [Richelia sinica]MBD2666650.1 FAD-dependent oxidoreductase [Richelia sinica FACHB-800]
MTTKLVLIGGGHSHAIVLKMFGSRPLSGVRLTLITPTVYTPYSGMLPGHIAGLYSYDECHINLQKLSNFAQANLYLDHVIGLDLQQRKVLCANRPAIEFDLLSIDIGSIPAQSSIVGAAEYAIAAKPVAKLLEHWYEIQKKIVANPQAPLGISIIGGGAGGVELALSMQANLHLQGVKNSEIHLWQRTQQLLPNYHSSVGKLMEKILINKHIKLHLGENVTTISPANHKMLAISCQSGLKIESDQVFCVTQASAPAWLKTTGLATDDQGFILVDDCLRSVNCPYIFAAGDISKMINYSLPKAGVFAVRQGQPLWKNLCRTVFGQPLKPYKPQKTYLSLIGTGDKRAIANKGKFTLPPSKLIWDWKDWIDRRFMAQFV